MSAEPVSRPFGPRELALSDSTGPITERMLPGPDVKETAPSEIPKAVGQLVVMEGVNTEHVAEEVGGASPQPEDNQLQPVDTSEDQNKTTGATQA